MDRRDTLTKLAAELGAAFRPLLDALRSVDLSRSLLWQLGWKANEIPSPVRALEEPLQVTALLVDESDGGAVSLPDLGRALASALGALRSLELIDTTSLPAPLSGTLFAQEFPRQVLDHLLVERIRTQLPSVLAVLELLDVVRSDEIPSAGNRPAYVKREIRWGTLVEALRDPIGALSGTISWGQSGFNAEKLLRVLAQSAYAGGLNASLRRIPPGLAEALSTTYETGEETFDLMLVVPFVGGHPGTAAFASGLGCCLLAGPNHSRAGAGLALFLFAVGSVSREWELGDGVALGMELGGEDDELVAIIIRPAKPIEIKWGLLSLGVGGETSGQTVQPRLWLKSTSQERRCLFCAGDLGGLDYSRYGLTIGLRDDSSGEPDLYGELELPDARLFVRPGDNADSFVGRLLPAGGVAVDFCVRVGISSSRGLYFGGSAGLEVDIPVGATLGPIEVSSCVLSVRPGESGICAEGGATVAANLGPLKATIKNVGLRATATLSDDWKGNLGPLDLILKFKPPDGAALAIDAAGLKGSGALEIDPVKGQYSGYLQLLFSEWLKLDAFGLITTAMPDGSKGFSLLVVITSKLGSGIQLGYGFVLLGVGGLLGLNRTTRIEALIEGTRTGSIARLMFPTDITGQISQLLTDVETIFPACEGRFLIGPMAKIGWSTPVLISVSLGIVIEIPPGDVVIIGVIRSALPTPEAPLVLLQASFMGALEVDKKRAYFFASLFESTIAGYPVDGDMGLLAAFGESPDFVLTVGGFHPQFNTPTQLPFPIPERLTLDILNRSDARIGVAAYLAITSNTVQFGARAELYFKVSEATVTGDIGFDVLVQFSPFHFIAEASASVSLKVGGVGVFSIKLRFKLSGPAPWRARGKGSISLGLLGEVSADFDVTWGEERHNTLPPIEVMPLVEAELKKPEAWTALLPETVHQLIVVRPVTPSGADVVLDPAGTLRVCQKAVPLGLTLDKIGNQQPTDVRSVELEVLSGGLAKAGDALAPFALAQFQDMDDAAKLTLSAFDSLPGGVELSGEGSPVQSSRAVRRAVRYDQLIIDGQGKHAHREYQRYDRRLFKHFLSGNAVSLCSLSERSRRERVPYRSKISVLQPSYAVVSSATKRPLPGSPAVFATQAQARRHMESQVAGGFATSESLNVVPTWEVAS